MRQRMQKMLSISQTYNPFYPPGSYPELKNMPDGMQQGLKRSYQEQRGVLVGLAKKARS